MASRRSPQQRTHQRSTVSDLCATDRMLSYLKRQSSSTSTHLVQPPLEVIS